jgi:hypothetical protein
MKFFIENKHALSKYVEKKKQLVGRAREERAICTMMIEKRRNTQLW